MSIVRVSLALTAGSGREFEVVCIRPGLANGLVYPAPVLERSLPLWDGVTSFVDHGTALDRTRAGYRSVRDVCGVVAAPAWDAARGLVARLRLSGPAGEALAPLLVDLVQDRAGGLPVPNVGLSADLLVSFREDEVVAIEKVLSVDLVVDPAAGGRVERVLNSAAPTGAAPVPRPDFPEGGSPMSKTNVTDTVPAPAGDPAGQGAATTPLLAELRGELHEARVARREMTSAYLRTALAASGLPQPLQQAVQVRLAQRADYAVADVLAEVEAQRTVWAALQEDTTVRNLGARPQTSGMQDGLDRLQLAADRLFGVPGAAAAPGEAPRLSGLRELYLLLSGDYEMHGRFVAERVSLASVTTTTMASVVKNALNKVLLASFELRPQWWAPIVLEEDFNSLNSVTWITLGGFGDLGDVAEGEPYAELPNLTDSEEVSPWVKKGGYIGITLEMIDRDNVTAVRRIPRKLGLAAWRTLSAGVANLFTANSGVGPYWPGSQTGYRLFDTQYANLGSTALAAASWDATVQAMYKQPEAASAKRLGVRPRWLIVPIELEKTALTILNSTGEPGTGNNDANVRAGSFGVVNVTMGAQRHSGRGSLPLSSQTARKSWSHTSRRPAGVRSGRERTRAARRWASASML
jgi:hypothetical protein